MSRHTEKGTVKIGSKTIQQGSKGTSSPPPSSTQSRRVKDVQEKNLQKTKREINEAIEKRQKDLNKQANIKDDGILAAIGFRGQDVDRTVTKENYKDPRKHNLRNQFDYLTDKYYGGDQEAFAKTSQGQVLLGYLAGVDADRGGGLGGDTQALEQGLMGTNLAGRNIGPQFSATQGSLTQRARINQITAFDIRNLNIPQVRQNFTTGGIEDTAAFRRFNEALRVAAPDAFAEARPNLGQGIGNIIERFIPAYISGPLTGLLPERATGGLTPDEYLDQDLFANLPMDERVDSGGVNEAAQSIINNQTQQEEEDEFDTAQFNPDSFIPGFGFPFVDPSLFNLDGTGITGLEV